jgi:hypothetical protein
MRSVEVDVMTGLQVAQVVGHESFADAVKTKVESVVDAGRGSQ